MKRREFLKQSATTAAGATALAAGAAPAILLADSKRSVKNPIVGVGEYRYECLHNWGQLPAFLTWQTTHGVTIDEEGLIYITHMGYGDTPLDTVVVFDPHGRYVRSFGKEYHKGGHGIDLRKEDGVQYLYLSDIYHRQVAKTTLRGEVVWKRSYPQEPGVYQKPEQYSPTNVAFAPDGGFYVGDGYGSHYIHQYDKKANWVRTWGGLGTAPGKFNTPHGLWWDDRPGRTPSLVVADRANARLQYFTADGQFITMVHDVLFPAHFDIRGEVLLVPDLYARVSLFDREDQAIVHLGNDPAWTAEVKKMQIRNDPSKWIPGKFVHPHDACYDRHGNIFVTEWVQTGRVTKLRRLS